MYVYITIVDATLMYQTLNQYKVRPKFYVLRLLLCTGGIRPERQIMKVGYLHIFQQMLRTSQLLSDSDATCVLFTSKMWFFWSAVSFISFHWSVSLKGS